MDTGPDSGGLEFVVGMRDAPIAHDPAFEIAETNLAGLPRRAVGCAIGHGLFMDRFTPHRALPNMTDAARLALVMWLKEPA